MPTLPSESHHQRSMAESFGVDPERYDRARPCYPDALVQAIAARPGLDVLDVGCGTGIATRQFQAAGCRVLGVDVDARMAEFARRGGAETEVAAFETWDPAGRTFDVVVAAQTWHWVDPVAGAAKAAAVLRPGGRLAVFWNVFQPPPEVGSAFDEVYRRVLPDSLSARAAAGSGSYSTMTGKTADGIRQTGAFGEPEVWRFEWERRYSRDEWLDQMPTSGETVLFPPGKLEELMEGIGAAIDALGGSFSVRYTAVVVTAALA